MKYPNEWTQKEFLQNKKKLEKDGIDKDYKKENDSDFVIEFLVDGVKKCLAAERAGCHFSGQGRP